MDGRQSRLSRQGAASSIRPVLNRASRDQEEPAQTVPDSAVREDLQHREQRFRLWYSKTGPAAYLSQLELQRIFERAFRRAELPLAFSGGFHPERK